MFGVRGTVPEIRDWRDLEFLRELRLSGQELNWSLQLFAESKMLKISRDSSDNHGAPDV